MITLPGKYFPFEALVALVLVTVIFIQILKYLLSRYYVPGTVLNAGEYCSEQSNIHCFPLCVLYVFLGRQKDRVLSVLFINVFPQPRTRSAHKKHNEYMLNK